MNGSENNIGKLMRHGKSSAEKEIYNCRCLHWNIIKISFEQPNIQKGRNKKILEYWDQWNRENKKFNERRVISLKRWTELTNLARWTEKTREDSDYSSWACKWGHACWL